MDKESKLPLGKILENISRSFFKISTDFRSLVKMEAQLATQSLVYIFFLSLVLLILLMTTWFCLLGLVITYLISLNYSVLLSLAAVTGLNVLLAVIIGIVIFQLKKNVSFDATRRQLTHAKALLKGSLHEKHSS